MKKISKPIIFFGSGPVAAKCLRLLSKDFKVEAVITKPQPSYHKKPYPVLEAAEELRLPILTARTSVEQDKLFNDFTPKSDTAVVIDHGIMISKDIIARFPFGIINSHFSLLPRWRGADPISFAILSGDAQTGVSLMIINDKLDEGDLIAQREIVLSSTVTEPDLTRQLITLSHQLLAEVLPRYWEGKVQPFPQPDKAPTYSRKLKKSDGMIDWHQPAINIERQVRAFLGWPKSHTRLGRVDLILTATHIVAGSGTPGEIVLRDRSLGVYCGQDLLMIDRLIPAGKKEMKADAFLNGYRKELA